MKDSLRSKLGSLARGRRLGRPAAELSAAGDAPDLWRAATGADLDGPDSTFVPAATAARVRRVRAQASPGSVGVEEFLPGGEWRDPRGAIFVHERLRSEIETRRTHWGRLGEAPEGHADLAALVEQGLGRALFLDLETGGLASSPVFLAGTMHWNGEDFVLRQYFARHYGEEATLVAAISEAARGFEFLVTFNGRSYDAPFLSGRAVIHGVPLALPPRHIDLLHAARRRWRHLLPDCRLQTLELYLTRRRRSGDVPGEEVPGLYHDFVRHGDPYRLIPVFHHNLLDVITMGEILRALCDGRRAAELED